MVSGLTSRLSKQFWGIIIKESNHVHLKRKDCAVFRGNLELQSRVKPGLTQLIKANVAKISKPAS